MYVCRVNAPSIRLVTSRYADGCMYLGIYAYRYVMNIH